MRADTIIMATCILALAVAEQTYQLVWSDEFNGNSLDLSKWQYEVNCDGGGNNEFQCYTNSRDNIAVRNGSLVITAIPTGQYVNGKQYTSGRINSGASAAWKYGRFDFRAKMPNGIYLWPALWLFPRDSVYGGWAASGEVDVMEHRGTQNTQESTLHYGGSWPYNVYQGSGPQQMPFDMAADFHIYSLIWTPTQMQFLVDNSVYYSQTLQRSFYGGVGPNHYTANGQPFDQYFFIVMNMAIAGNFFGPNAGSLTLEQARAWANPRFEVDYVRVYQLADTPTSSPSVPKPTTALATTSSPATSAAASCASMYAGLTCRTISEDPNQIDPVGIMGTRNWLCSNYPQFCSAFEANSPWFKCNVAEQLSFGMNQYWSQFSWQGPSACVFGGIAQINTNVMCPVANYCPSTLCACNGACFLPSMYCCKNNSLTQIAFC